VRSCGTRVHTTFCSYHTSMAYALMRSAGSMHRLAQASVASSVLVSDWVQPAGITSLLAWHRQSTTDHRKMFSSEDKQGTPHAATQDQAENSKQPSPDKPQQAGFEASAGWFLSVQNRLLVRQQLEMQTCVYLRFYMQAQQALQRKQYFKTQQTFSVFSVNPFAA